MTQQILGVRFFAGSAGEAVRLGLCGGLVVAPAAPALVDLTTNAGYRAALLAADLVLADSGFMVLLWRLFGDGGIERVSGLEYLALLLAEPAVRQPGATFWVMPAIAARDRNLAWLHSQGWKASKDDCYVAPIYPPGAIHDVRLEQILADRKPRHVIIALGGGVQEQLGHALKSRVASGTGIHCTGAAIGFLSGEQVSIPMWADALYLGWFMRCLTAPRRFIPRYWRAIRLAALIARHRSTLPPLSPPDDI